MNFKQAKESADIVDIISNNIAGGLKRQGSQYVGNCPFHDDVHASLKVTPTKNIFKCFACGKGGDVFDFFTLQGKTPKEAYAIITNESIVDISQNKGNQSNNAHANTRKPKPMKWINAVPDQLRLPNPLAITHPKYESVPAAAWAYHDANGNIIGYTCRFNLPDGKKDVLPYSFKQQLNDQNHPMGNPVWRWQELDKPRPLYNLPEILARTEDIILVVEGEKTAEAGKRLFPKYVVTTWIGGAENIKYTDFSPLENRRVYLWPDNDLAGIHAMIGGWSLNESTNVYKRIKGISEMLSAEFKWIKNHQSFPKKWDIADADWSQDEAFKYLKANRFEVPKVPDFPPFEANSVAVEHTAIALSAVLLEKSATALNVSATEQPEQPQPANKPDTITKPDTVEIPGADNMYFRCLGFENTSDQMSYVFFVYRTNTIVKLTPSSITSSNVLQLAPLNYWEGTYPKQTRSGSVKFEISAVADALISINSKIGIFNPRKIRGRGAWLDQGMPVVHCGNRLIVNGVSTEFSSFKSKYIYEAGQELGFEITTPLAKKDAYKVIQILERLNFSRDIDARLLAGWIVIAPLCGALSWRSHLWLTGASGTGKTWIMNQCVKRLIGEMLVDAQSGTTEAGIRQFLGPDALPVKFDEAESEDQRGNERMRAVLEIMRASSASDSGKIIKGSGSGSAAQYELRSCFAFASIGANLTHRSDISRITVIEVKKDHRENARDLWNETREMHASIITADYVKQFQSRSICMLPIILANAETFSRAAAAELDSQRTGDQLGALLAGAYSLTSDKIISFEDARKWIKEKDWSQEKLHESTRDEVKLINKIMDSEITIENISYGRITRTIGEIVLAAMNEHSNQEDSVYLNQDLSRSTLRRIGMKIDSDGHSIVISDSSDFISRILKETPYSKNYNTILIRLDGASKMPATTFASGVKQRAIKIETSSIFEDMIPDVSLSKTENDLFNLSNKR